MSKTCKITKAKMQLSLCINFKKVFKSKQIKNNS